MRIKFTNPHEEHGFGHLEGARGSRDSGSIDMRSTFMRTKGKNRGATLLSETLQTETHL